MRKSCDNDETIEEFHDLTPAEKASRDARRARALERDERPRRRPDPAEAWAHAAVVRVR
jgi:hypothetical protein